MDNLIEFLVRHPTELFYIAMGIGVILYSSFAKRMSFEGDFPSWPEKRKTYEATPQMRKYGIALGMLPLFYGLYSLLYPLIMDGRSGHLPH